jgi:hypothetical protein
VASVSSCPYEIIRDRIGHDGANAAQIRNPALHEVQVVPTFTAQLNANAGHGSRCDTGAAPPL